MVDFFNKIFPENANNNYSGNRIALWALILFLTLMTWRSAIHMFFEPFGLHEIANIVVLTGDPDPMPLIYRFFSFFMRILIEHTSTTKKNKNTQKTHQDKQKKICTDEKYDSLVLELKHLEKEFPELTLEDSPSLRVKSGIQSSFPSRKHHIPMLSLGNIYTSDELKKWHLSIEKFLGGESPEYVCELKIDGVAVSIIYNKGILGLSLINILRCRRAIKCRSRW